MGTKCKYCGSLIDDVLFLQMRGQPYCSNRCAYKDVDLKKNGKAILASFSFSIILSVIVGVIVYFSYGKESIGFIIGFFSAFAGVNFFTILIVINILISITLKRIDEKKKKLEQNTCVYCRKEIEKSEDKEPTVCMSCGKKIPFCVMCGERIDKESEVFVIEPCGHTGHKRELLDLLETEAKCPLCGEKIEKAESISKD